MTNPIAGLVFAGGEGKRLGMGEKALVRLGGGRLIDAVLDAVLPQVDRCALSVWRETTDKFREFEKRGLPILTDPLPERIGPLGGLVAGLDWAATLPDCTWLATFPCDTPFLQSNLVASLLERAQPGSDRPVVATDGIRLQPLCALWPIACRNKVKSSVAARQIASMHDTLAAFRAVRARPMPRAAFFNINTREDLATAEKRILRVGPSSRSARR